MIILKFLSYLVECKLLRRLTLNSWNILSNPAEDVHVKGVMAINSGSFCRHPSSKMNYVIVMCN